MLSAAENTSKHRFEGLCQGGGTSIHGLRGPGHVHTWEAQLVPTWGSRGHSGWVGSSCHICQNPYHSN